MFGRNDWLRYSTRQSQLQSLLVLGLLAFFIAHFVLLSPAGLEEDFNGVRVIHPRDLLNFLKNEPASLARDIPTDSAPSYSIRTMNFFSSDENQPQWKMKSRKSNLYQAEQLIHSRDAELLLSNGTQIQALELAMWQNQDRTELYGNVQILFPNGLRIKTDYAEIKSKPALEVNVPLTQKVTGTRRQGATSLDFESMGLAHSESGPGETRLLSQVQVWIRSDRKTWIRSDFALYQPQKSLLSFQMFEGQKLDQQFVRADQVDLKIKSRSLEVQLAQARGPERSVETLTALGDVRIEDRRDSKNLIVGTSGRAVYFTAKNEIEMTDYPQVYQDGDTITGDVIVFNRNQDSIEVKQSNAIYQRN